MAITLTPESSGNTTSTSITVTLPAGYAASDFLVLFVSRNNAGTLTFGSNVTATVLADGGGRMDAYRIVPDTLSETDFTVSGSSSVWTWMIATATGVDASATVNSAASAIGNNTSSAIAFPVVTLGYVATGNELLVSAGGVNATATWTTTGETVFSTTSGNAAMMVNAKATGAGGLTGSPSDMDRGLSGTTRNETAVAFVLQEDPNGQPNLLTNGSFELGSTVATGWETEGDTDGSPQYTLGTTGVADGSRSQNVQYAGTANDDGSQYFAIYQAPIGGVQEGDVLEFSVYLSGSMSDAYLIVGIEGFLSGGTFISEEDTQVTSLDGTPTKYTVQYTCPANTDYVAVYIQCPEVADATSVNVNIDKATLVTVTPTVAKDAFTSAFNSYTNTLSWSHACSGSDRLLVVGAVLLGDEPPAHDVVSLTYNGSAMTKLTDVDQTGVHVELWYMVNPPSGSHSVVITHDGSFTTSWCIGMATSFTGVDQSSPIDVFDETADTGNAMSVSLTTTGGNRMVVDAAGKYDTDDSLVANAGQAAEITDTVAAGWGLVGAMSVKAAATAGTHSTGYAWSDGNDGAMASVALRPAAAASAIKTVGGVAIASVKTASGVAIASVKAWNGVNS